MLWSLLSFYNVGEFSCWVARFVCQVIVLTLCQRQSYLPEHPAVIDIILTGLAKYYLLVFHPTILYLGAVGQEPVHRTSCVIICTCKGFSSEFSFHLKPFFILHVTILIFFSPVWLVEYFIEEQASISSSPASLRAVLKFWRPSVTLLN